MQKTPHVILILSLVLVALATPAWAQRVLVVPTADVLSSAMEVDFVYHRGVSSVGVQFGIYPGLGAGLRQELGGHLHATLKAAILEETENRPGFAIGGELSLDKQHVYAVVSKQLGNPSLRGHAAFGLGRFSRGMAGLTYMLNPVKLSNAPTTSLFVEYDGLGLNGGLIAQFSPEFRANLGFASGHGLSVGINYQLVF